MEESAKLNDAKHQCLWYDHDTGEHMVPKLYADMKTRNDWRKIMSDRMFQIVLLVIIQGLIVVGGVFKWSGDIHRDLLILQNNTDKVAMKVDEHSKILDRYVCALVDFQAQSRKDEVSQREISDRMYKQKE